MERRAFLTGTGALLLAAPLAAAAQKSEKLAHVGILGLGPTPSPQELAKSVSTNPFWLAMRQLGWVDGQNMVVERRFGESADQLRRGAADLVRLKVDVLFVSSAGLAKILQLETKTIPIVVGRADEDLVAAGLVDSLAKPGGNITGSQLLTMSSSQSASSSSKRLYRIFQRSRSFERMSQLRYSPRYSIGTINGSLSRLGALA